jgi:hypothetical protein
VRSTVTRLYHHHRRAAAFCVTPLLAITLASGCGVDTANGERTVTVAAWDTVWQTSSAMMDSLIPSPGVMVFNDGRLFVVDRSTPKVVALNARTGTSLWGVGRRGAGPQEFAGIASAFPDRGGGVAVVDTRNRRVTRMGPDGVVTAIISTGELGQQPNQACRYGDDRFVAADVYDLGLLPFDSGGTPLARLPPLWPDLATGGWESHQVILRSDHTSSKCLVALSTGGGFSLISAGAEPVMGRYIEAFEPYGFGSREGEGEMKVWATYQASLLEDTVMVLFSGQTSDKDRIIDRYSTASGSYIDTYRLPFATRRFTAGDQMVFVLDTSETRIVALRPRR